MNAKARAIEIYQQHIALATTDGRLFRKNVMDQLMAETGCSLAAAATHYNNAKKMAPVEGLGRATPPAGLRKPGASKDKDDSDAADELCYTVIELLPTNSYTVTGRMQSFALQGDASEFFDIKAAWKPKREWVMIEGIGPNPGDSYRLASGEKEIKRYTPETVWAAKV